MREETKKNIVGEILTAEKSASPRVKKSVFLSFKFTLD